MRLNAEKIWPSRCPSDKPLELETAAPQSVPRELLLVDVAGGANRIHAERRAPHPNCERRRDHASTVGARLGDCVQHEAHGLVAVDRLRARDVSALEFSKAPKQP